MGRTPCCDRNGLKKGPWTQEEDQKLMDYIQKHGHGSWRTLPKNAVNPEILRLATNLLSSHRENPEFFLQDLEENQFCNSQVQKQFPSFQANQLQTPIQECAPFQNETQFMEANVEQFPSNPNNFSCQNSQLGAWQDKGLPSNLHEDFIALANFDYYSSDQPIMEPLPESLTFRSIDHSHQNFGFGSALPTPSSSPTHMNSSSTYINSSTEDERDSYCSNILKFEFPDILGVSEFM
ncbi:hypothetical protein HHK36_003794 [Tetracentron sinense]|uniref:Uncharacterized protein n=1 Tax=Tetracentron sinense TaxID=13715 RepID=A0A834ZZ63_TETSI|nr:hypothetical protein HHK36_003794 [Tetracentron sinense]